TRKMVNIKGENQARMAENTTTLSKENSTPIVDEDKKFSMRSWSCTRCSKSPMVLESKNAIGNFMSFIRKSDINDMLIRDPTCSSIQLRNKSTVVCEKNSMSWAASRR